METETGVIKQVEKDWAWVETNSLSICAHFSSGMRLIKKSSKNSEMIKVRNLAGAMPGDMVELHITKDTIIKLFILLYILPATALLVAAFSADSISRLFGLDPILGIFIFSSAGFTLTLVLVRIVFNRVAAKTNLTPVTRRVILRSEHATSVSLECLADQSIGESNHIQNFKYEERSWGELSM